MSTNLHRTGTLAFFALAAACSAAVPSGTDPGHGSQAASGDCAVPVITGQSLFVAPVVTDAKGKDTANPLGAAVLQSTQFSFESVMNQIVSTGAKNNTQETALDLYQQMLGTLNDPPCTGTINGFPVDCPREEGALSSTNPFEGNTELFPIALVNRFDLAPNDGSNCGEYRIVYALLTPFESVARFLMILEATLPNPEPKQGLAACLPVAQFWDNLSVPGITQSEFVNDLTTFYFQGIPGLPGNKPFPPVVRAQNYGIGGDKDVNTGQIRVNMLSNDWQLREFTLSQVCAGAGKSEVCTLVANNTLVKNNPFGGLFDQGEGASFQKEFIKQVATLAGSTIPSISMSTPLADCGGQSTENVDTTQNDYACQAGLGHAAGDPTCSGFSENTSLSNAIAAELTKLDITGLTPEDIVQRATTQSCAGCHQLSPGTNLGGGLTWPASNGFVQVDEQNVDGKGLGHQSPALVDDFLPFRSGVLTNFINSQCGGADGGADGGDEPEGNGSQTVGGTVSGGAN
jgi:hypothetical protein